MSSSGDILRVLESVSDALSNPKSSTGTLIPLTDAWVVGNQRSTDRVLAPVSADDFGRLWREVHHGGHHALVCVADLRKTAAGVPKAKAPAPDAPVADFPDRAYEEAAADIRYAGGYCTVPMLRSAVRVLLRLAK